MLKNTLSNVQYIKKTLVLSVTLLLILILIIHGVRVYAQGGNKVYIELHARQWAYEPSVIEVNQGDIVTINVISDDVSHGFYLEGYNVRADVILIEGGPNNKTVTFVADKPGAFTFRCSVTCGPFHPFMTGKLIVKPSSPVYYPLYIWIAIGVVATIISAIILFRRW